jgi:hypothetical protein
VTARRLALVSLLSSAAAVLALVPAVPPAVRAVAVLAFASLGPGSAIMAYPRRVDAPTAWALALVLSLTVFAGASAVQVWTAWWQPRPALVLLALASAAAAAVAFTRGRPAGGRRTAAAALRSSAWCLPAAQPCGAMPFATPMLRR